MKVLETTVQELNVECERAHEPREIPSETEQHGLSLRNEEGCHEADQAGCGRTDHGETQQLQARLDEITTKRDGTKKDVSDRDSRMNLGLCQRS